MDKNLQIENNNREFRLNLCTNGHCFLCLKLINKQINKNVQSSSASTSCETYGFLPFQNFCKRLKINLKRLITEKIKSPAIIAGKTGLDKPKMKVELCRSCERTVERFSDLFQEQEKIQMEMDYCMSKLHDGISSGKEDSDLSRAYQEVMTGDIHSLFILGFIDELKNEIFDKCKQTKFAQEHAQIEVKQVKIEPLPSPKDLERLKNSISNKNSEKSSPTKLPRKFECGICYKVFSDPVQVKNHKEKVHPRFSQDVTGRSPSTSKLNECIVVDTDCTTEVDDEEGEDEQDKSFLETESSESVNDTEVYDKQAGAKKDFKDLFLRVVKPNTTKPEPSPSDNDTTSENTVKRVTYPVDFKTGKIKCRVPFCKDMFSTKESSDEHFDLCHRNKLFLGRNPFVQTEPALVPKPIILPTPIDSNQTAKNESKSCKKCKRKFNCNLSLKRHKAKCTFKSKREVVEEKEQKKVDNISLFEKRSILASKYPFDPQTGRYKCAEASCSVQFAKRVGAKSHHESIHLKIRYKCDNCKDRDFRFSWNLTKHLKTCTKKPKNGSNNKLEKESFEGKHDVITMTDKKEQRGEVKRIKFGKRGRPEKYSKDNATERFKCSELTCPSKFSSQSIAHAHYQSVHLKTRYKCDRCLRDFAYYTGLSSHKKKCFARRLNENPDLKPKEINCYVDLYPNAKKEVPGSTTLQGDASVNIEIETAKNSAAVPSSSKTLDKNDLHYDSYSDDDMIE